MYRILFFSAFFLFNTFVITSCKKVEGKGGSSSISGKIIANKKNSAGVTIATFEATNHDVYIIYGAGAVHDDKTETSYDGTFTFRYLEKGDYTIYTYEDCNTCASGDNVKIIETSISKAKEEVNIGTIEVND
ncbi:hypothetical protein N8079_00495 [Crocinitomicaceae bacterium]|nr:hypothetical protein [Crocinitomicaceae bacterium]